MLQNISTGKIGEKAAENYLIKQGYTILHTHFTTHWGELDIVAKKGDKLIFFEVKTRTGETKGRPYESITKVKIEHLKRSMQMYLQKYKYPHLKLSLDAISVILDVHQQLLDLKHYENIYS